MIELNPDTITPDFAISFHNHSSTGLVLLSNFKLTICMIKADKDSLNAAQMLLKSLATPLKTRLRSRTRTNNNFNML